MNLNDYFSGLIKKVQDSEISNAGRDKDGFFRPTRVVLLRHLQLLKDLHVKPLAKPMLQASWRFVVEELPPEWLVLDEEQKAQLQKILE